MILNTFNVQEFIKNQDINDSDIIDYSINSVKLSINPAFDWESLAEEIEEHFPQGNFKFNVIALNLIITWD